VALPFVVQPKAAELRRIGTETTGILEVPVKGGLTVGESDFVADQMESEESAYVAKAKAAEVIATAESITRVEALAVIESMLDGAELEPKAKEIAERHEETLLRVAGQFRKYVRTYRRAVVGAILSIRLGVKDWKQELDNLDPVLFDGLYQLASEEQTADQGDAEPPTEDELGKQPEASSSANEPTGARSSGRSQERTPVSSAA
jgi:hypothetical protein